jgi:tetratricopeptide (TPR) repeat protein
MSLPLTPPTEAEVRYVIQFVFSLKQKGDLETAEKLLKEGLTYLKNFSEINYNSYFRSCLARILYDQKKYTEAESVYREALIELEQRYGALREIYKTIPAGSCNDNLSYMNILSTMNNYALVLSEIGKMDESENVFKMILAIKQHIFKPTIAGGIHESTLRSLERVGIILHMRTKYEEAVGYLQSSFNWKSKMYGNCCKETLTANNYLCHVLQKLGRHDEHDYWFEQGAPHEFLPLIPFKD